MQGLDPSGIDKDKPLIVIAGRSNVGKSSTIRALTGKKVRVGKHPGSTKWEQLVNLGSLILVDIPGFGYMAKTSKTEIENTKKSVVHRLEKWSGKIALSVLIIDLSLFRKLVLRWEARNEIPIDIEFYTFLHEISQKVIVAANKIDKVVRSKLLDEIQFLVESLTEALPSKKPIVVPISASKGEVSDLKEVIEIEITEIGIDRPRW